MKKHLLITGGSRNLGYAMAERMIRAGWAVHLTSRSAEDAAEAAEKLRTLVPGAEAFGYAMEQSRVEDIRRFFRELDRNTDHLDGFIANAANLGVGKDVFTTDEEAYDRIMDVNAKGTFFCCQEAAKRMTRRGGAMVLIGSVQGVRAVEGRTVYGISKAAVSMLSKYLAYDLAPYGIRVNCIVAGAVHSDRWDALEPAAAAGRRANYPLGRESDREEVAAAAEFLLSDGAATTTGAELLMDSGLLLPALPYRDRKEKLHDDFGRKDD